MKLPELLTRLLPQAEPWTEEAIQEARDLIASMESPEQKDGDKTEAQEETPAPPAPDAVVTPEPQEEEAPAEPEPERQSAQSPEVDFSAPEPAPVADLVNPPAAPADGDTQDGESPEDSGDGTQDDAPAA